MKISIGLCLIISFAICRSNAILDDSSESSSEELFRRPWSKEQEQEAIAIAKNECGHELSKEDFQKLFIGWNELYECGRPLVDEFLNSYFEFSKSIDDEQYNETAVILKNVCPKVRNAYTCLNNFKKLLPLCLDADQMGLADMFLRIALRFIDFVCHNNGEYTMAFFENNGRNCTQEHQDEMFNCVEHTKEKYEKKYDEGQYQKNGKYFFQLSKEECDDYDIVHNCVVDITKQKCDKKIISEVIDNFLTTMKEELSCGHLQNVL